MASTLSETVMPYNRVQVRGFLSQTEIELFEASLSDSCRSLASAALNRRVERARTLRDKYRDLLQRQALATRARTGSKKGPTGSANERTHRKAKAMDEALKRFEAEAARRGAPAPARSSKAAKAKTPPKPSAVPNAPVPAAVALRQALDAKKSHDAQRMTAATPKRSAKAPAVSPSGPDASAGSTPPAAQAAALASKLADANLSRTQGHISTQVRRSQARKDHRG